MSKIQFSFSYLHNCSWYSYCFLCSLKSQHFWIKLYAHMVYFKSYSSLILLCHKMWFTVVHVKDGIEPLVQCNNVKALIEWVKGNKWFENVHLKFDIESGEGYLKGCLSVKKSICNNKISIVNCIIKVLRLNNLKILDKKATFTQVGSMFSKQLW